MGVLTGAVPSRLELHDQAGSRQRLAFSSVER